MKKTIIALAVGLSLIAGNASAITVMSRPSSLSSSRSFSSSSFRSSSYSASRSSFSTTRSYTAPRSYAGPSRSYSAPKAASFTSRTTVRNTVVNNHTTVVHHYPSYGFYHPPVVYPVYVHHAYAYDAFNAILAWQMLSAAQRASTPMPPVADLTGLTYEEMCRAIWADGKMTLAEVKVYQQWQGVHGGAR